MRGAQAQQRGIKATTQIVLNLLEGLLTSPKQPVLVVDLLPSRRKGFIVSTQCAKNVCKEPSISVTLLGWRVGASVLESPETAAQ